MSLTPLRKYIPSLLLLALFNGSFYITSAIVDLSNSKNKTTKPSQAQLNPALKAKLARRFAPQLRFNAYFNDGNRSPQNRHEDFFPMGVASFFKELESGRARVLVKGSRGEAVGVSELKDVKTKLTFDDEKLGCFPKFMVGDVPGQAAIYPNLYLDKKSKPLRRDGAGELSVIAEYWVFYPHDRSEAKLLGSVLTKGHRDFTGHRGDWEHTIYILNVKLGEGSQLQTASIQRGVYYGHGNAFIVEKQELEFVDDKGQKTRTGTHPVVYISQGKHASYPAAGEWKGHAKVPSWLAHHTDFFRGNGVIVNTWEGRLPDIGEPRSNVEEFGSQAFKNALAQSPKELTSKWKYWTDFKGYWGPDSVDFRILGRRVRLAGSPRAATGKGKFGQYSGKGKPWIEAREQYSGLKIYKDEEFVIPACKPTPFSKRR
jgi:hypothetical protein